VNKQCGGRTDTLYNKKNDRFSIAFVCSEVSNVVIEMSFDKLQPSDKNNLWILDLD
jgi:hypothetical protein